MSTPLDIRKYTEAWLDVFEWFEAHPQEDYTIECHTRSKAVYTRFEFYKARKAMEQDPGFRQVLKNAQKRKTFIEGSMLVFRYIESVPLAQILRESLDANK